MNDNAQLRTFPDISFVDVDTQRLVSALIGGYERIAGRTLFPADPVRLFILWIADIIAQERVIIDSAARQNVPRFAEGAYLDSLAEIFNDVWRMQPAASKTTLRFTISAPQSTTIVIPAGTRVSVGEIVFATTENGNVTIGETFTDVPAQCEEVGTVGNGFMPGQISNIVDLFEFFESVENITVSEGGADLESDEAFYNRLILSMNTFSTAGAVGAYEYWAKTASAQIIDVRATTPSPGAVDIRVLLEGGALPGDEIKQLVYDAVSEDKVRPLTDTVQVNAPDDVTFNVDFTYFLYTHSAKSSTSIQAAVNAAIDEYIQWQTGRIGRDINPDVLVKLVRQAGAKRVEITSPVFTVLEETQVGVLGVRNPIYGGLEDE